MKIINFVAEVARREGGKVQVSVAQVSEVLKIVNEMLWGVPYFLIRLKGKAAQIWTKSALLFFYAVVLIGVFFATQLGVYLLKPYFEVQRQMAPDASPVAGEDCGGNTRPVAVIEVMGGAA